MRRTIPICLGAAAAAILALGAATVSAKVVVSPTSVTFPDQAVGSKSATVAVTLTKDCTGVENTQCLALPGLEGPTFNTSISVSGPFSQTNNCPAALTTVPDSTASCTINVAFSPTTTGAASGTLSTGSGGPTASLSATGVKAKKCKKKGKKSASAAKKKCKKKKK
jgi:hypothetical protein